MNPRGYKWEDVAFAPWRQGLRLTNLFKRWRGEDVEGKEDDGATREELDDVWQGFAYDIVRAKEEERRKLRSAGLEWQYKPLRMYLTGSAGTGKSRTLRSLVRARREAAKTAGCGAKAARESCVLAAPTGSRALGSEPRARKWPASVSERPARPAKAFTAS